MSLLYSYLAKAQHIADVAEVYFLQVMQAQNLFICVTQGTLRQQFLKS